MFIFWIVVLAVVVFFVVLYNRLVSLRNLFKNAFAQIDVQLKRRYDLIPNLVETAKGYLKHEAGTLQAVTAARAQATEANTKAAANPADAGAMRTLVGAESVLAGALSKLFAVVENYPDLKAVATMQQLMEELSSTENKISFARQAYNDSVMRYNNARETFPGNLIAGSFGFLPAELYQIESFEERKAVKVQF
jgi:LemA protein